ncbi:DUF2878 domain-containing protein [Thalassotalea euphylliae]|uniref:DUF2878 domain-containing protein n=1 Tax=Thalassotalea euphylliae TaxID=1655234 RepID=UPI0036341AB9
MIINALLFNLSWFGLIFWGNTFAPVALGWVLFHVLLSKSPESEIKTISIATLCGVTVDTILMHAGVFNFNEQGVIIPFWLIALWLAFSATLNHSMQFFTRSKYVQLAVGALCVPMSYLAGEKLGAVAFGFNHVATMLILSVIWVFLFRFLTSLNIKENKSYA